MKLFTPFVLSFILPLFFSSFLPFLLPSFLSFAPPSFLPFYLYFLLPTHFQPSPLLSVHLLLFFPLSYLSCNRYPISLLSLIDHMSISLHLSHLVFWTISLVARSLASCQGALLLVDSTQSVQAQTLANHAKAKTLGTYKNMWVSTWILEYYRQILDVRIEQEYQR